MREGCVWVGEGGEGLRWLVNLGLLSALSLYCQQLTRLTPNNSLRTWVQKAFIDFGISIGTCLRTEANCNNFFCSNCH